MLCASTRLEQQKQQQKRLETATSRGPRSLLPLQPFPPPPPSTFCCVPHLEDGLAVEVLRVYSRGRSNKRGIVSRSQLIVLSGTPGVQTPRGSDRQRMVTPTTNPPETQTQWTLAKRQRTRMTRGGATSRAATCSSSSSRRNEKGDWRGKQQRLAALLLLLLQLCCCCSSARSAACCMEDATAAAAKRDTSRCSSNPKQ